MEIETYEVEEIGGSEASNMAADSAAIELIDRLGLAGQKKLMAPETGTRNPYRRMTRQEETVFTVLFPTRTKPTDFSMEIIPLRVLEALDRAKQTNLFIAFAIWHDAYGKDDPILIGHIGEPNPQSWNADYFNDRGRFLIARWGKALLPFEKLVEMAREKWCADRKAKCSKAISSAKSALETLQEDAQAAFLTGDLPSSI